MIENSVGIVCLNSLRAAVHPIFRVYDEAVHMRDRAGARRAKRAIVAEGKQALAPLRVEDVGGVYLFVECIPAAAEHVKYIGRSRPSRPLARRIVDRFRDDTALDSSSYDLPYGDVRDIAYARMRTAMRSRDETLRGFAEKHCRTMEAFKSLSYVIVVPIRGPQSVIDDVEHLLIYSASQIGCALTNVQERRRQRVQAGSQVADALSILYELRNVLDVHLLKSWSDAVDHIAN
jgi:hypothetical protein